MSQPAAILRLQPDIAAIGSSEYHLFIHDIQILFIDMFRIRCCFIESAYPAHILFLSPICQFSVAARCRLLLKLLYKFMTAPIDHFNAGIQNLQSALMHMASVFHPGFYYIFPNSSTKHLVSSYMENIPLYRFCSSPQNIVL